MPTNLFFNLPTALPKELFTTLLQAPRTRIERIISHGHQSPDGFWTETEKRGIVAKNSRRRYNEGSLDRRRWFPRALGPIVKFRFTCSEQRPFWRSLHRLTIAAVLFASLSTARTSALNEPRPDDFAQVSERARRLAGNQKATSADRVAMVTELSSFPTAAAATLIVSVGLASPDTAPRSAAREALVSLAADRRINAHLVAAYRRESSRSSSLASELGLVLLATEEADAGRGFRVLLDRMPPPAVLAACEGVCSAAVSLGDTTAVHALSSLARAQCFTASLACRRRVIAALTQIPHIAAVEALVELLGSVRGEARGDILTPLVRVSGKSPAADQNAFRAWLDTNRGELGKVPLASDEHPALIDEENDADDQQVATYYDIPIYADRVVFVIDTSGSMEGERLETAKRELMSAIFGLPDESFFTVLFFHSRVGAWQQQLVPGTTPNKQAAADFVSRLSAGGGTATCDALQAALAFDSEAIFFLTDGAPSQGRIVDPAGIVQLVAQLNAGRGISVNTISIMGSIMGGGDFLQELANANLGRFRSVDD